MCDHRPPGAAELVVIDIREGAVRQERGPQGLRCLDGGGLLTRTGQHLRDEPALDDSAVTLVAPAVPQTKQPAVTAIWTTARPTAPLAPWTSSVSEGRNPPRCQIARYAVAHGTPTPAPCAELMLSGSGKHWATLHTTNSAKVPVSP